MDGVLTRLKQYLNYKNISVRAFEMKCGFSNGSFGSQLKNGKTIGVDRLEKILHEFADINIEWLLTGRGPMLRNTSEPEEPAEKQSCVDEGLKNDTVTVARLLEIVKEQVDIIKEQNREISRLRNRISLANSGIGIVGRGNLQNPPTSAPSQCGSAAGNPSLEVQNPAPISVEKRSRK